MTQVYCHPGIFSDYREGYGSFSPEPISDEEQAITNTLVRNLERQLHLPTEDQEWLEHGARRGLLDDGNLWQVAAGMHQPRCFSTIESLPQPGFTVGLLVDCSGSMSDGVRMRSARCLAMALARVMDGHQRVRLSVAGHTEVRGSVVLYMIKRANGTLNSDLFSALTPQSGNLDGFALLAFASQMRKDMGEGHDNGLIALICDGQPCHSPEAMRDAIKETRRTFHLQALGIGVGGDMSEARCKELYGDDHVIVGDPIDALPRLVTTLNKYLDALAC